jgi:U3 small nucleolar RNA-associated protein 4
LIVSWWAQEARIWRYSENQQADELPKLLARMGLKGDENITSASIDETGHLLALATAAASRIFQVTSKDQTEVRLRKLIGIELPGARLVKLSPDAKWIAMITHDNSVKLARILLGPEGEKPRIVPCIVDLGRLSEPDTQWNSTNNDGLDGLWGHYRRTITNVEFSTDSRVIAVGDLAGYLDVFTLQGHEDSTAPEVETTQLPATSGHDADSDDEDDLDSSNVVIKGQSWKTHPRRFPKLSEPALIMSFRPPSPDDSKAAQQPNGNPGLHPTRRTPHPRPRDTPADDYHLLVVDGHHQIYEFDTLTAKLTTWARQNPRSSLPPEFTSLKDRAMGCVWDITADRQRLWLYGSSWLFMFNLGRNLKDNIDEAAVRYLKDDDIEVQLQYNSKARRKHFREVQNWQKQSTGAGDRIRDDEVLGLARQMNKFMYDAEGRVVNQVIDTENTELEWKKRQKMKRNAGAMEGVEPFADDQEDEDMEDLPPLDSEEEESGEEGKGTSKGERIWWNTHKYRPILGIVPLRRSTTKDATENGEHDTEDGTFKDVPEVVLVERPLWDVDLPPKFVGAMERENGEE